MIKAIRGTRDLLPPETALWNFVEAAVRDVFRVYNFHEIRTPIFEETQLFARSVGEETDIVSKEMYTWYEGADPEAALQRAWYEQYKEKYTGFVSHATRQQIEIEAHDSSGTDLIEVKFRPDAGAINRLNARKQVWLDSHP